MDLLIDKFKICKICNNPKVNPKRLLCLHSFCGKCVDSYISSYKEQDSYPCPVCLCNIYPKEGQVLVSHSRCLRPDLMNGTIWQSFEFNRAAPGGLKYKKFCWIHDTSPVQRFCFKHCTTYCCSMALLSYMTCSPKHRHCETEELLNRQKFTEKANSKLEESVGRAQETYAKLDSLRNSIASKVSDIIATRENNMENIERYFSGLRKQIHDDIHEKEIKALLEIDQFVDKRTRKENIKGTTFEMQLSNIKDKVELLKYADVENIVDSTLLSPENLLVVWTEMENILREIDSQLVCVMSDREEGDVTHSLYLDTSVSESLSHVDIVDIELLASSHSMPFSSSLPPTLYESSDKTDIDSEKMNDKMKNIQDIKDNTVSDDDVDASPSNHRLHLDDKAIEDRRRTLRTWSVRRERVFPTAPLLGDSGRPRMNTAAQQINSRQSSSISVDDIFNNVTYFAECNSKLLCDTRVPKVCSIARIAMDKFLVADRFNKSLKLFSRSTRGVTMCDTFVLDCEPWAVSNLPDTLCIVSCPDRKKMMEFNVLTGIVFQKEIRVSIGYANVVYMKTQDRFVCSVCPPYGDPQINILNRSAQILQVIMADRDNSPIFSYPRHVALSSSDVAVVLDMNHKSVIFLHIGEIFSSVFSEFKGDGDLGEPQGVADIPFKDLTVVVYQTGTLVIFSHTGQLLGIFDDKIARSFPKCLALTYKYMYVGHADGYISCYDLH